MLGTASLIECHVCIAINQGEHRRIQSGKIQARLQCARGALHRLAEVISKQMSKPYRAAMALGRSFHVPVSACRGMVSATYIERDCRRAGSHQPNAITATPRW